MNKRRVLGLVSLMASTLALMGAANPETIRTLRAFHEAGKNTVGPRAGDIFFLPQKFNYVIDEAYSRPTTVDLDKISIVRGTTHGTSWEYDTRVPLLLYGPGYIQSHKVVNTPVTQEDLVPTLAHILKAPMPEDAQGRVLKEALKDNPLPPKAILVLVFDQGGRTLLEKYPDSYPFMKSLMAQGTWFEQAKVTHLDAETFVGHISIGTGAYPAQTGVPVNGVWMRNRGVALDLVNGETTPSPLLIESPSLADVWLNQTQNKAIVYGQSLADRAAMGMVGHGSLYKKNKKPYVLFLDGQGRWSTNENFYSIPSYTKELNPKDYWNNYTLGTGVWKEHRIDSPSTFKKSAAVAGYEADAFMAMLNHEPIGQDDVTDLLYLSFKGSDYVGHTFGQESGEMKETLQNQDAQAKRIIEALRDKVGGDRLVIAFLADHGGTPLCELTGGTRLLDLKFLNDINTRFDHLNNGEDIAQTVSSSQLFLNQAEMKANKVSMQEMVKFIKNYQVNGKPFFLEVVTREELASQR